MKRILENMKPYFHLVLVAIALLFVQAWADLRLPGYMSDIVNVGIQQSGIEHASPDVMTQDSYEFISAVLPQEQAQAFESAYTLENGEAKLKSDANREATDLLVGQTMWTLGNMEIPGVEKPQGEQTISQDMTMDDLYPMTPLLQMVPNEIKVDAYNKASTMEEQITVQSGIVFAKLMYEDVGQSATQLQNNYIMKTGFAMMGVTLIGVLAAVSVGFVATRVGAGFSTRLRGQIFRTAQNMSNDKFDDFSASSLVVRTINDVTQVQMMVMMSIRIFFYAPIMAFGGIRNIAAQASSMTWIIGAACLALLGLLVVIYFVAVPKFEIRQKFVDKLNLVYRENLSGLLVMRAFGNKSFETKRFDDANKDVADVTLFVNRVMSLMMPIMMLIMNLTVVAIIWFGAGNVSSGVIQIGDMMAFMQYAMQIIMAFLMISMMFIFIPRAMISLRRINEVLDTENTIKETDQPLASQDDKRGFVEFENVSFGYEGADEYILHNISFTAKPGETVAFIGSTGSGKSTLINLIPRFYDVNEGSIKVNGVDVRKQDLHALRQDIGYVPQKGVLLSGTVEENLRYGRPDAPQEDLDKAIEVAQARFILEKEEGLEFAIAQGGTNVSGGQRQRLSIARALTKDASVYIFDDSFSALDYKTDQNLRTALHKHFGEATLLIVAQRVNTIVDADKIIVLDRGEAVGIGTHKELLKTCPTYYEIASSQLSEEELNHEK